MKLKIKGVLIVPKAAHKGEEENWAYVPLPQPPSCLQLSRRREDLLVFSYFWSEKSRKFGNFFVTWSLWFVFFATVLLSQMICRYRKVQFHRSNNFFEFCKDVLNLHFSKNIYKPNCKDHALHDKCKFLDENSEKLNPTIGLIAVTESLATFAQL